MQVSAELDIPVPPHRRNSC